MSRFDFGKNWETFLQHLDENRIEQAKEELQTRFDIDTLTGTTFADIGCGSGLFSLAAHRLGAEKIVSLDYDSDSVECCKRLRDRSNAENWEVLQGDILNRESIVNLGTFDHVYCWGVAHHTGEMWTALDNLTSIVSEDGLLCIGLYHRRDAGLWNSHRARQLKRYYNSAPRPAQHLLVLGWGTAVLSYRTLKLRENPISHIRSYKENRGMSFWTDVRDWVGGYPFEFASPTEVKSYFEQEHPGFGFVREDVPSDSPSAVDTYVFKRS